MEALNAAGLTPLSALAKRTEPRSKNPNFATISQIKNQSFSVSRNLQRCLVLLSSIFSSGLARALTYDEALQQSATTGGGGGDSISDIDVAGALDSFVGFAAENPIIVGGAAAVVAVPVVASQLLSQPRARRVVSAKNAFAKLGDDQNAQLVDIRLSEDVKKSGSPDTRGFKKKAVGVVYKGDDKPGFLKKLGLKFKEPENTTLFILDKFDGNSELVVELVTANRFKAAYAIKDGAEGPRGWKNSGVPWILPNKALSLDISKLTNSLGEASDVVPLTLSIAAASGLGKLTYTEVETILQVLHSAAIVQFVSKKLLFAEDRKQTIRQIEEVLNTKVAPKDLMADIQQIGKAILPTVSGKAPPVPAEVTTMPEVSSVPPKVEAAPKPTLGVNAVPKAEVQEGSPSVLPRPLSPYPNYPDYKLPSSPMPSQPNFKADSVPIPNVNFVPKAEVQEKSLPMLPRTLSPYPNYPDYKPPSLPIPSQP